MPSDADWCGVDKDQQLNGQSLTSFDALRDAYSLSEDATHGLVSIHSVFIRVGQVISCLPFRSLTQASTIISMGRRNRPPASCCTAGDQDIARK